jgi:hypothetical protein
MGNDVVGYNFIGVINKFNLNYQPENDVFFGFEFLLEKARGTKKVERPLLFEILFFCEETKVERFVV